MRFGYKYKLKPSRPQLDKFCKWLDMLRANYNYNLADREATYRTRFAMGDYCDLRTKSPACPLTCPVSPNSATSDTGEVYKTTKKGKISRRNACEIQQANLPVLKKVRPWYKGIDSTVLQYNVERLDGAYRSFFEGLGGYPKRKNRSTFKSLTFKTGVRIKGNSIYLPKLGWMGFHNSQSIPDGFKIKSATVRLKADGLYVSLKIKGEDIPGFRVMSENEVKTVVGLDMGITKLVHCSDGSQFNNPKHSTNKRTRKLLKVRQRRLGRKKKGSKNRKKAAKLIGRLHQKITNKREAFQWQLGNKLTRKADAVVVEDLNISGMKKRCKPKEDVSNKGRFLTNGQSRKKGLNRSISDASWYSLTQKIEYLAAKQGKVFKRVNPRHTSQTCPKCGYVNKANRNKEKFLCSSCGYLAHADLNAARNIKQRGIEEYCFPVACEVKIKMVPEDFREPKQLKLFEMPIPETTGVRRRAARL
ncbi:MAG: transposase [Cyanobacteria bacterium P01_A01_bin.45]